MITSTNWRSTMASAVARVELAVERDDAAERGFRVGLVGAVVGREQASRLGDAARVGVLDDHAGRRSSNAFTHSSAASVSAMLL